MRARLLIAAATLAGLGLLAVAARAADPDALWKIVHGRCVPDAAAGNPAPCVAVTADWAVLKDIVGATQFLLIPTAQISGIENPAVLAPDAPNYFAAAWQAQSFLDQRAGRVLPREDVALAINPPAARSQNQLHIHVDCVRPDVLAALAGLTVGDAWTALPEPIAGQRYMARHVAGDTLTVNPFRLLADGVPGAAGTMADYTLVVVGRADGFVLLAGRVQEGGSHGEDAEDHACAVARSSP